MASTLQLDSFRPAGRKAASMPLLSPGADLGAGGVIVLHVEQAGGGGAYAGHALGLGQRGQPLRLVDGQGRGLDDKVMSSHKFANKDRWRLRAA